MKYIIRMLPTIVLIFYVFAMTMHSQKSVRIRDVHGTENPACSAGTKCTRLARALTEDRVCWLWTLLTFN